MRSLHLALHRNLEGRAGVHFENDYQYQNPSRGASFSDYLPGAAHCPKHTSICAKKAIRGASGTKPGTISPRWIAQGLAITSELGSGATDTE